jgi:CheY-like chemotaxis protein
MNKTGPIILIDDDIDDLNVFKTVLESLPVNNEILIFQRCQDFLNFLKTRPNLFFILCDVNMPSMDGFELRQQINQDQSLAPLSIPFIFLSTSSASHQISKAYQGAIQGYFVKPGTYEEIKSLFRYIIEYWTMGQHPPAW